MFYISGQTQHNSNSSRELPVVGATSVDDTGSTVVAEVKVVTDFLLVDIGRACI